MNYVKVPPEQKAHVCVCVCVHMFISKGRRHINTAGPQKSPDMECVVVNLPLKEENVQPYEYLHTNYSTRADPSLV